MKKSLQIKWIKALRDGKYKQCRENMVENGKYCCLGVLAKTCKVNLRHVNREGELSDNFLKEIGMTHKQQVEFIQMNDDQEMDFKEIADRVSSVLK